MACCAGRGLASGDQRSASCHDSLIANGLLISSRLIILKDLGLSLAIITVLMPLSLFETLGLTVVVFVHELTEIVVIANGVRRTHQTALPDQRTPCRSVIFAILLIPERA